MKPSLSFLSVALITLISTLVISTPARAVDPFTGLAIYTALGGTMFLGGATKDSTPDPRTLKEVTGHWVDNPGYSFTTTQLDYESQADKIVLIRNH